MSFKFYFAGIRKHPTHDHLIHSSKCRWFIRTGGSTFYGLGFRSFDDAVNFIHTHPDFDDGAGNAFRLKGDSEYRKIVDRKGRAPKSCGVSQ